MPPKYVRGLVNFITELRAIKGEDEKLLRVKEEIAKVRIALSAVKIDGYNKRKCILKLLYIEMMGYDVDLGYLQSVELISSSSYIDKAVGYMGCEVLLHGHTDLLRLCINTTLEDMRGNEGIASLALNFVANTHSEEVLERIGREVLGMLSLESPHVRKKLYMCLYRLHDMDSGYGEEEWRDIIGGIIEREHNPSCVMAVCSLAAKIFGRSSTAYSSYLVSLLWDRMNEGAVTEYDYFSVSSPWLLIKLLSILSVMETRGDESFLPTLSNCLRSLLDKTGNLVLAKPGPKETSKSKKFINLSMYLIKTGILRETIRAIVNWFPYLQGISSQVICNCIRHLYSSVMGQVRLVALEIIEDAIKVKDIAHGIKNDMEIIIHFLNEADPTIKKRAALILCGLCDSTNWETVVPELVSTLRYSEIFVQEYIVPLACKMIDNILPKNALYIDLIFKIIIYTPLLPNDSVCFLLLSALQSETSPKFREQVVAKCIGHLIDSDIEMSEGLLRTCAYVLGDYGYLSTEYSLKQQVNFLNKYFSIASSECRGIMITSYGKMVSHDNSLLAVVEPILEIYVTSTDVNLQNRVCEMLKLLRLDVKLFGKVFRHNIMPKRESSGSVPRQPSPKRTTSDVHNEPRDSKHTHSERESIHTPQVHRNRTADSHSSHHAASEPRGSVPRTDTSHESPTRLTGNTRLIAASICTTSPSVIFSNDHCRIIIEQAYKHQQAKLLVKIENTSGYPIQVHGGTLKCPVELSGLLHNNIEGTLEAGAHVGHRLSFMLVNDVAVQPLYTLEYTRRPDVPTKLSFELPVMPHKFMRPYKLEPSGFTALWNKFQGKTVAFDYTGKLEGLLRRVQDGLNFFCVQNDNNIYASGSGIKGKTNQQASQFVALVIFTQERSRIIANVRTSSDVLTKSIINATRALFNF